MDLEHLKTGNCVAHSAFGSGLREVSWDLLVELNGLLEFIEAQDSETRAVFEESGMLARVRDLIDRAGKTGVRKP